MSQDIILSNNYNAVKYGIWSKQILLPWEDHEEYELLLSALMQTHQPADGTEYHLVLELVNTLWRKKRLCLAGNARILNKAYKNATGYLNEVADIINRINPNLKSSDIDINLMLQSTPTMIACQIELLSQESLIIKNVTLELKNQKIEVDVAIQQLPPTCVQCYHLNIKRFKNSQVLVNFLENKVLLGYENEIEILKLHPIICSQLFAPAYYADGEERYLRYEITLDRKCEKTLAMLIKLQELRKEKFNNLSSLK